MKVRVPGVSSETAYYLNSARSTLALIGQGMKLPAGQWIRVAAASAEPWNVQQLVAELFPALRTTQVRFRVLLTEFDVEEFEHNERRDASRRKR